MDLQREIEMSRVTGWRTHPGRQQSVRCEEGIARGYWVDKKGFYEFQMALYAYANNPVNGCYHPKGFVDHLTDGLMSDCPDLASVYALQQWQTTGEYNGSLHKPWLQNGDLLPEFKSFLVQGLRQNGDNDVTIGTRLGYLLKDAVKMCAQWDAFKRVCEREASARQRSEAAGLPYDPPPNLKALPHIPDDLAQLPPPLEQKALPPVDPNFEKKLALAFENARVKTMESTEQLPKKPQVVNFKSKKLAAIGAKVFEVSAPHLRSSIEEAIYNFLTMKPDDYLRYLEEGGRAKVNIALATDDDRTVFWQNYSLDVESILGF